MKNKILAGLACVLLFASAPVLSGQASKESVRLLMNKTGSGDMGIQMVNQMIPALKKMIPNAPEKFWTDMMAEMKAEQVVEMVVPVYQKHLTQKDVDAINAFYDTPAGKKLISVQPAIVQESMAIGQKWGQETAHRVIRKYKEAQEKQSE